MALPVPERHALEQRWLRLTRVRMPEAAAARGWPVRADHCFQRILLDGACEGVWYARIAGRPAYAHASDTLLRAAVALGEACLAGGVDLPALNRRSLRWRARARFRADGAAERGAADG